MRNVVVGLTTALVLGAIAFMRAGGPMLLTSDDDAYSFMAHQPSNPNTPVTYSSCKPVRVQIDTTHADDPTKARNIVLSAMGEVSAATGLDLVYVGPSDQRPSWPPPLLTIVGGERPVLVSFATVDEVPQRKGNAGVAASSGIIRGDQETYVTGQAALEADYFNTLLDRPGGEKEARAIAMHELGHVVGLAHVQHNRELMSAHGHGQYEFADGDRHGLTRLGKGPCT